MIEVYCDSSVDQVKGVSSMIPRNHLCAAVSTTESWEFFSKNWEKTLSHRGLNYFHATDFEFAENCLKRGVVVPSSNDYSTWKLSEFLPFFSKLANHIKEEKNGIQVVTLFNSAVDIDFFEFNKSVDVKFDVRCKSPYVFNLYVLMSRIAAWVKTNNINEKIRYYFEHGDRQGNNIFELFKYICDRPNLREDFKVASVKPTQCYEFVQKKSPPTQVADIIAFECSKLLTSWYEIGSPSYISPEDSRKKLNLLRTEKGFLGERFEDLTIRISFNEMIRNNWNYFKKEKRKKSHDNNYSTSAILLARIKFKADK